MSDPPKTKPPGWHRAASRYDYKRGNHKGSLADPQWCGADPLLRSLEGVRQTGAGTWIARCPAHDDRRPSLSIRELSDGRVLVHCFAECATEDVLRAVGLDFAAICPRRALAHCVAPERRPFPAMDALRCVRFEALVAAVAAGNLANGLTLSEDDRARLLLAARRLQAAAEACRA